MCPHRSLRDGIHDGRCGTQIGHGVDVVNIDLMEEALRVHGIGTGVCVGDFNIDANQIRTNQGSPVAQGVVHTLDGHLLFGAKSSMQRIVKALVPSVRPCGHFIHLPTA